MPETFRFRNYSQLRKTIHNWISRNKTGMLHMSVQGLVGWTKPSYGKMVGKTPPWPCDQHIAAESTSQTCRQEVLRQILCGIRDLHSSCIHRRNPHESRSIRGWDLGWPWVWSTRFSQFRYPFCTPNIHISKMVVFLDDAQSLPWKMLHQTFQVHQKILTAVLIYGIIKL